MVPRCTGLLRANSGTEGDVFADVGLGVHPFEVVGFGFVLLFLVLPPRFFGLRGVVEDGFKRASLQKWDPRTTKLKQMRMGWGG